MDKIIMCGYSVHRQYTSQGEKGRFYAFRLQSHGECDARLNGEPLRLKKGDLLMMVPGDRLAIHKPFNAADASDTSGDYYLLCQGDWIASWFRRLNGRRHLEVPTGESILDLWKLIIRETHRLPDAADGAYLEALLHAFCLSVEHLLHPKEGFLPDDGRVGAGHHDPLAAGQPYGFGGLVADPAVTALFQVSGVGAGGEQAVDSGLAPAFPGVLSFIIR